MVRSFALAYGVMSLILILGVPRQSLSQNTRAKSVFIRSLPSVARYENDLNRIQELVHTGRYSQALERIDELLKQVPDMAQGRFLKGVALAERGQINQAITEFRFLMTQYPFLPEPYNNLAVLYARQQQYDQARESLLKALETHTSYATAYQNLSNIYAMMAGEAYDKALGLNAKKKQPPDLQLLGDLYSAEFIQTDKEILTSNEIPIGTSDQSPGPGIVPEKQAIVPAEGQQQTAKVTGAFPQASPLAEIAVINGSQAEIAAFIDTWKSAWSSQNADAYIRCYGSDFKIPTRYKTRSAWEKSRRWSIARPSFVEVVVQNLEVYLEGDNSVRVTFRQLYRSDRFQEKVQKTLTLKKVGVAWRIVQETSVKM